MDGPDSRAIIERERSALERWSAGDPVGYAADAAEDVTYFDDIGAQRRVRGAEALRAYTAQLEGSIPAHDYAMVDPLVQVVGDVGILTYLYEPSLDGEPLPAWRATTVYGRTDGAWRLLHAHWSILDAGSSGGAAE